jgi:hypothetical protein
LIVFLDIGFDFKVKGRICYMLLYEIFGLLALLPFCGFGVVFIGGADEENV